MKANIRLAASLIVLALAAASPVRAQARTSAVFADLYVNGIARGGIEFALDGDGRPVFVAESMRSHLAGTVKDSVLRSALGKESVVGAGDLARFGILCSFDAPTLRLNVEVAPSAMESGSVSLASKPQSPETGAKTLPPESFSVMSGVSLDVLPRYEDFEGTGRPSISSNLHVSPAVRLFGFVLEGSSTIAWADSAFSYGVDSARGVFDVPSAGIRLAGGLIENRPFGFQGKAKLIGVSVSRESVFPGNGNERPDIGDITLKNPATVAIEVNGIAARTLRLGPGVWHVSDLPLASGLNDVVVRIAEDGRPIREIRLGIPFDLSILDPGQIDYAATGGVARSSPSRPFGSAWFRAGIARSLEIDMDLEGMPGLYLGGLSALWASPIGFLGAGGSLSVPFEGSAAMDLSGAAKVSWRFASAANRYVPRLGLAAVYRSAGFIAPSDDGISHDPQASPTLVLSGQIAQTLPSGIGSLGIFADSALGDRGLESLSVQAGYFLAFAKSFSLSLAGGAAWKPGKDAEPRASVVLTYTPARVGSFQYRNDVTGKNDSVDATLLLNEAGSAAVGARYSNLVWMADSDRAASVFARLGAGFGDVSSSVFYNSYARSGSFAVSGNLSASTGIAFAGGTFALGAARDESYVVLAPSSAFSGTRVSLRTSDGSLTESKRGGAVSVGGLSLYRPISATVGLPASNVDKTPVPDSVVLNPGYKSVTIIRVDPASSLVVRGRAVDARGSAVIGESGAVTRAGKPVAGAPVPKETFTDETGVFECYGLEAGDYSISWSGGKVSRITVPKGKAEGTVDIGTIPALSPETDKGGTK